MIDAMASVIQDEEVVWPIMFVDELADMVIELVLRLLPYVQFDRLSVVVEVIMKKGIKFLGLIVG